MEPALSKMLRLVFSSSLVLAASAMQIGVMQTFQEGFPDFRIHGMIDVGANAGLWTRTARALYPESKIFMVEASAKHNDQLVDMVKEVKKAEFHIAVLSGTDRSKVLFHDKGGTGDSMFVELTRHYNESTPIERESRTLDSLVEESDFFGQEEPIDYLKIDVQGAELLVLTGCQ